MPPEILVQGWGAEGLGVIVGEWGGVSAEWGRQRKKKAKLPPEISLQTQIPKYMKKSNAKKDSQQSNQEFTSHWNKFYRQA